MGHPWAKEVESFVNVDGAGAGGRAVLLRGSSQLLTSAFTSIPHPHGSVLFSDAFSLGLVRSQTDYAVYSKNGMKGLDYVFYQRRSKYHTAGDTVDNLGDKRPLWYILDNLRSLAAAFDEGDSEEPAGDVKTVYFDGTFGSIERNHLTQYSFGGHNGHNGIQRLPCHKHHSGCHWSTNCWHFNLPTAQIAKVTLDITWLGQVSGRLLIRNYRRRSNFILAIILQSTGKLLVLNLILAYSRRQSIEGHTQFYYPFFPLPLWEPSFLYMQPIDGGQYLTSEARS